MHFLGRRLFLLVCLAGGVLRIAQAQNVLFPIGIFGVVSNIGTPYASGTGTTLDKIKGSPELGYLSGFNVVQSYWHKSNFDHVSNSGMGKFLNHAASLGFSVLVTIPGSYETIPDGKFTAPGDTVQGKIISPPGEGPHLLQRSPPDCSEAIGLISMIKSRRSVYGYYIADEPTDVYSVRAFYSKAVSAQNLALALGILKSKADAKHPYLISLADYDERPDIWGRSHTDVRNWRWNDTGAVTYTEPQFGGQFQTSLNYDKSADIILNDTYVINNNAAWVTRLYKFDDLVSTKPGKVQALIACQKDNNGIRNDLGALRLQVYTAIIHGVTGIWFYSYSETFDGPVSWDAPSPYFVKTLVPLSVELAALRSLLEGTTIGRYMWGVGSGYFATMNDQAIHYILKREGNVCLIVAANTLGSTIESQMDLTSLSSNASTDLYRQARLADVLFEPDRSTISINGGILADRFKPWEVHVYRIVGQ